MLALTTSLLAAKPSPYFNEDEWETKTKCIFALSEEGAITAIFKGEEHFIKIYPIKKDLVDRIL